MEPEKMGAENSYPIVGIMPFGLPKPSKPQGSAGHSSEHQDPARWCT